MKSICLSSFICFVFLGMMLVSSCTTEVDPKLLPVLSTTEASKITEATAQTGGNITSDAGSDIIARGVCWSTSPNPTIKDSITLDAAGSGAFISKLSRLTANTTYYVRAYATNKKGTSYGLQVTFTTKTLTLTTNPATTITVNSAICGGEIKTTGDSVNVLERGICWNTQTEPTILNNKTSDGIGAGKFTSIMTNLAVGTKYYVRAYIKNTAGVNYGNEINFTTSDGVITLTTTTASSITATSATIGGTVPNDSCSTVTERGLCISKLPSPTIANKMANGSGKGSFATNITGLTANTTYYVRAYATNSVGTSYGNEISFKTLDGIIALSTTAASSITATAATIGGSITADGGATITARGFCWSKTPNPTIADGKSTSTGTIGSYATNISGLSIGSTYYVRVYATNSVGTYYGNEVSFTTLDGTIILTTTVVSSITAYTAKSGGNISSDGGGVPITDRGICWSTSQSPSIANSKVSSGTGMGIFTGNLSDLNLNTTYYVRAFATNSVGVFYGNEVSFTTQNGVISLTTIIPTIISTISAISGGNIISDGGGVNVTNRGICWSTSSSPTVINNKVSNGSGLGSFSCKLLSLSPNTTYYLRSFATNNAGTYYGNEISFTTPNTVTDIDGNVYNTAIIGNQIWMSENLKTTKYSDGTLIPNITDASLWILQSSGAWCYYNNDNSYNKVYGKLYNCYAATDMKKLAPEGWHIPTKAEWTTLINYLGGTTVAGGKLKDNSSNLWKSSDITQNDFSFNALPGGARSGYNGSFNYLTEGAIWWSNTESGSSTYAYCYTVYYNTSELSNSGYEKSSGLSIRCIKD